MKTWGIFLNSIIWVKIPLVCGSHHAIFIHTLRKVRTLIMYIINQLCDLSFLPVLFKTLNYAMPEMVNVEGEGEGKAL